VERLAQLLDDLDDLICMVGLVSERIRNYALTFLLSCAILLLQAGGIVLALRHPPLALATAILLFISLLYRSVTSPRLEIV
jgi:hypothetical protein